MMNAKIQMTCDQTRVMRLQLTILGQGNSQANEETNVVDFY